MAKEITIQQPIKKWEAFDGTQFDVKEECQKYENAAINVVKKRLLENAVRELENEELECIECGLSDEHKGFLLNNKCFQDIQLFCSINNYTLFTDKENDDVYAFICSTYDSNAFFFNISKRAQTLNNLISEKQWITWKKQRLC